jgi:hypothetical protein
MDQNIYVLYAGGSNFSFFTTVIVKNFEVDYLLNCWSYRNTGSRWSIILDFQQLFLLAKLIRHMVREIANLPKADKSILFQIVLDEN